MVCRRSTLDFQRAGGDRQRPPTGIRWHSLTPTGNHRHPGKRPGLCQNRHQTSPKL